MNVFQELAFTPDKPSVQMIKKNDSINYLAVGLLKDQILPKHTTSVPTTLLVLKVSIEFTIEGC